MKPLEKFGKFMVENLRDKAMEQHDMLQAGKLRGRAIQDLQRRVGELSEDQKATVKDVLVDALDTALHDLLFAFQDAHDRSLGVEVLVDGENVAELSGMLQGEPLGEDGWVERFSRYKALRRR